MVTTAHNLGMRLTLAMNSYLASGYTKNQKKAGDSSIFLHTGMMRGRNNNSFFHIWEDLKMTVLDKGPYTLVLEKRK